MRIDAIWSVGVWHLTHPVVVRLVGEVLVLHVDVEGNVRQLWQDVEKDRRIVVDEVDAVVVERSSAEVAQQRKVSRDRDVGQTWRHRRGSINSPLPSKNWFGHPNVGGSSRRIKSDLIMFFFNFSSVN